MSNTKKIKVVKFTDYFGVVIMLPNGELLDITRRDSSVDCDHRVSITGDSLGAVIVDRGLEPAGIKSYCVWNQGHVAMYGGDSNTYADLVEFETDQQASFSSVVTTDDIGAFVDAITNEFNGELSYHYIGDIG